MGDNYNAKQDRHCRYHVTLKRVHVTIVAMKNQYVLHIPNVFSCT